MMISDFLYQTYFEMINFDNLKRNYQKFPLKKFPDGRGHKVWERPFKEDLKYLYLDLLLPQAFLQKFFGNAPIFKFLKEFQIQKSKDEKVKTHSKILQLKYNVSNSAQLEISKIHYKETVAKKYGKAFTSTNQVPEIKQKQDQSNLKRYGFKRASMSEKIKSDVKKRNFEKYGSDYIQQTDFFKKRVRETNLRKFGFSAPAKNSKIKQKIKNTYNKHLGKIENPDGFEVLRQKIEKTCIERYGCKHFFQTSFRKNLDLSEIQEKIYQTKKLNHTFNSSKTEFEILTLLKTKFQDVKAQYKDSRYPFACDFYIPSLDLFLEFQGTWTHGGHPFDETNPKDLELLELWKKKSEELNFKGKRKTFYKNAIYVWTKLDVKKRQIVRENNLNFKEFFSKKEFEDWFLKV